MTAAALLMVAGAPLFERLFPPNSMAVQLQLTPYLIMSTLDFCLAAAFLALWRAAPDFRAFRGLGFFYVMVVLQQLLLYFGGAVSSGSVRLIAAGLLIETAGEAMRIPRRNWTRLLWPVYIFGAIAAFFPSLDSFRDWPFLISEIPLVVLAILGVRSESRRDRMIAIAFLGYSAVRLTLSPVVQHILGISDHFPLARWQWQYATVGLTVLGATTLTIFVRDLIHDRSEKQRLSSELAASRAIQQMIVPERAPQIDGFLIHSKYQPFGEVGGDFFQILSLPEGGALLVIGDVSGKGTPAAMLVSLLVGTLLALVETTTSPGLLLDGLNRCVRGRSCDGFTTCLILRLGADGLVTFANAGHIPPYRKGQEVPCENGLPLGLIAGATYPEAAFDLNAGEQITLLTDGVVEARNQAGELFGFERTAAISSQDASSIALAAEAFGQDDDITVLTVTRLALA